MSDTQKDWKSDREMTRKEFRKKLRKNWKVNTDEKSTGNIPCFKDDSGRIRQLRTEVTAKLPCRVNAPTDPRYSVGLADIVHLLIRIAEVAPPEVYHCELSDVEYNIARSLHQSLNQEDGPLRNHLDLDIQSEERVIANLKSSGYATIDDLAEVKPDDLLQIPYIGKMAAKEISKNVDEMKEYRKREKVDLIEQQKEVEELKERMQSEPQSETENTKICPFCSVIKPEQKYEVHIRRCEEA